MKYIFIFLILTKIYSKNIIKKCIDCKYYLQNKYVDDQIFGKCLFNPTKLDKVYDLISGELLEDNSDYEYCITARQFKYLCGSSAKFFILKKINDLPVNDLPVNDLPINDLPINDLPINDLPVNDLPVNDLPVNDLPINDLPIND